MHFDQLWISVIVTGFLSVVDRVSIILEVLLQQLLYLDPTPSGSVARIRIPMVVCSIIFLCCHNWYFHLPSPVSFSQLFYWALSISVMLTVLWDAPHPPLSPPLLTILLSVHHNSISKWQWLIYIIKPYTCLKASPYLSINNLQAKRAVSFKHSSFAVSEGVLGAAWAVSPSARSMESNVLPFAISCFLWGRQPWERSLGWSVTIRWLLHGFPLARHMNFHKPLHLPRGPVHNQE